MSVIISGSFVLGSVSDGGEVVTSDNPLIGYQNLVTSAILSSTTASASFPVGNIANPATYLRWLGTSVVAAEYVTMAVATANQCDYVGIARHNFGTAQIAVSLELFIGGIWTQIIAPFIPATDGAILMRFTPQAIVSARVRMQPSLIAVAPTIATIYLGKLLVSQRRLYVGHTPLTYGQVTKVVNGRSEAGQFLGRVIVSSASKSMVDLQNLTPDWYRTYFAPFLIAAREIPFFFAWRPGTYPNEVGYAWITNDPQMQNQRGNGMVKVSMELGGISP